MQYFTFLLYTLLFITISVPVAIVIFKFFDIRFEVYGNYLFWLIALALFNALLPYQTKDIFYKGSLFQAYTNDDPMENAELDSLPSVISDNKSPLTVIDTVDKVNSKLSPSMLAVLLMFATACGFLARISGITVLRNQLRSYLVSALLGSVT